MALNEPGPAGRLIPYITIRRRNGANGGGLAYPKCRDKGAWPNARPDDQPSGRFDTVSAATPARAASACKAAISPGLKGMPVRRWVASSRASGSPGMRISE